MVSWHDLLIPNSEIILVPAESDLQIVILRNQLLDCDRGHAG